MKFRFLASPLQFLYDAPDAGAGGGGSSASSDAGAAGAGGQGTRYEIGTSLRGSSDRGGPGQRQPQGQGTAYRLTDDSLVDLGDGKGVKWSEAKGRFVPREEHQRVTAALDGSRDMLLQEAQRLDREFAKLEAERRRLSAQGRSTQRVEERQADITEELQGMPLLDGPTAARVVKQLRENGLAPIASLVTKQQATITQLQQQMQQLQGTAGTLSERHQSQEFDRHISSAIDKIPEIKGLSQPLSAYKDSPVVRDILSDLWLSYDAKTWKMDDFYKMASERMAGLVALVRADQTKAVESAKLAKRKFFQPGGGGHPSGQGNDYRHLRGLDIARQSGIFDRSQPAA